MCTLDVQFRWKLSFQAKLRRCARPANPPALPCVVGAAFDIKTYIREKARTPQRLPAVARAILLRRSITPRVTCCALLHKELGGSAFELLQEAWCGASRIGRLAVQHVDI